MIQVHTRWEVYLAAGAACTVQNWAHPKSFETYKIFLKYFLQIFRNLWHFYDLCGYKVISWDTWHVNQ